MGKSGRKKKPTAENSNTNSNSNSNSSNPPSSAAKSSDPSALLHRANELKEEGNRRFQARDYAAALRHYDAGLALLPRSHPDRALLHSNRAACLLQQRPVDHEAVAAECSLALRAQPGFPRALLRRARALESLRRPHLALQDALSLLSLDPHNPDALLLAQRLQSQIKNHSQNPPQDNNNTQQQQPSPAALGASAAIGAPIAGLGPRLLPKKPSFSSQSLLPATPRPAKPVPFSKPKLVVQDHPPESLLSQEDSMKSPATVEVTSKPVKWRPLKLVYDHDIRLSQMPVGCSFKELREIVGRRFPSSKFVLVKYKDGDGDLVTVTSTAELRVVEDSVEEVLRLHVVEVGSEQEPPLVEEEEEERKTVESEGFLGKGDEGLIRSPEASESVSEGLDNGVVGNGGSEEVVKDKDGQKEHDTECKEVEIDDWLLEFAQLFRNQVGIDPEAHVDLHELGMELCSEALEETVTSVEAQELFEMAAAKFQEVAALAFFNWGNVHMCAARKRIPLDETSPKEVMAAQLREAYDWVRERYGYAGVKYEEALRIKPDFYEGLLALGQQHFETAKLHWSFALANKVDLTTWDSSETTRLFDTAEEKMKAATEMWEKVEEQRIAELNDVGASKKDELLKKRMKQRTGTDGQGELSADEAAEQATVMRSQIHLFWGNMLFERSQVEFKLAVGDWKKNLDGAVERFKLAGASEADISVVLKNHSSNSVGVEGDEKKVTNTNGEASEGKVEEDKHELQC